MSPEENPPQDNDSHSVDGSQRESSRVIPDNVGEPNPTVTEAALVSDAQDVESAEIVEAQEVGPAGVEVSPEGFVYMTAPPIAGNLENMSANGGAIGSLVLGIWCVIGSFITNWSIINGLIGLLMGFWGLTSRKQRMAWIGITLCVIGIFMSLVQVSELVNMYLKSVEEDAF